jgi:hypothetical protein
MTLKKGATCFVPANAKGDLEDLCGKPAATERVVEGLVFPLCAEHAEELDTERREEEARARTVARSRRSRERRSRKSRR